MFRSKLKLSTVIVTLVFLCWGGSGASQEIEIGFSIVTEVPNEEHGIRFTLLKENNLGQKFSRRYKLKVENTSEKEVVLSHSNPIEDGLMVSILFEDEELTDLVITADSAPIQFSNSNLVPGESVDWIINLQDFVKEGRSLAEIIAPGQFFVGISVYGLRILDDNGTIMPIRQNLIYTENL